MTETKKIYEKINDLYELNKVSLEKNSKLALKKESDDANILRNHLESRLDKN